MSNNIRQRIGAELRTLREAKGLTTRELAERCGLIHSHIVRIESGRYGFSIDTLDKLTTALGAEFDINTNYMDLIKANTENQDDIIWQPCDYYRIGKGGTVTILHRERDEVKATIIGSQGTTASISGTVQNEADVKKLEIDLQDILRLADTKKR
jgi:transcriptional regulator with XRE-family HTH domain